MNLDKHFEDAKREHQGLQRLMADLSAIEELEPKIAPQSDAGFLD